jgi:hypothetical protein
MLNNSAGNKNLSAGQIKNASANHRQPFEGGINSLMSDVRGTIDSVVCQNWKMCENVKVLFKEVAHIGRRGNWR